MKKMAKLMLVALSAVLVFTACAGKDKGSGSSGSGGKESKGAVEEIKKRGKLTIATGIYMPFEYRDPKTDELVGYDIDLAQLIADKLGVDLEVKDMQFTSLVPSVKNGDYDLAVACLYDTPARREEVLMSDSYIETGLIVATKKGNPKNIKSLDDCGGLRVGVKVGGTSEKVVSEYVEKAKNKFEVVGFEETVPSAIDLEAGRIDVLVNDYLNQLEINKTYKNIEIVSEPFTEANLAIAAKKGNEDLMKVVNEVIKEYKEDGTQEKLYKKWVEGTGE